MANSIVVPIGLIPLGFLDSIDIGLALNLVEGIFEADGTLAHSL